LCILDISLPFPVFCIIFFIARPLLDREIGDTGSSLHLKLFYPGFDLISIRRIRVVVEILAGFFPSRPCTASTRCPPSSLPFPVIYWIFIFESSLRLPSSGSPMDLPLDSRLYSRAPRWRRKLSSLECPPIRAARRGRAPFLF